MVKRERRPEEGKMGASGVTPLRKEEDGLTRNIVLEIKQEEQPAADWEQVFDSSDKREWLFNKIPVVRFSAFKEFRDKKGKIRFTAPVIFDPGRSVLPKNTNAKFSGYLDRADETRGALALLFPARWDGYSEKWVRNKDLYAWLVTADGEDMPVLYYYDSCLQRAEMVVAEDNFSLLVGRYSEEKILLQRRKDF